MAISRSMKLVMAGGAVGLVILAVGLGVGLSSGGPVERSGIFLEYTPKPTANSLIDIKPRDQDNVKAWTDVVEKFLRDYKSPSAKASPNIFNCDYNNPLPPMSDTFCDVNLHDMGPCASENFYGFGRYAPCVFLTLNKVLNWVPEPYSADTLPTNMTADLQTYVRDWMNTYHHSLIWLKCDGETPADREYVGKVRYYPSQGFPTYYFPYRGAEGYLSPLVALHFERPQTGVVISMECKVWARNIPYDRERQLGSVRFQLLINH